MADIGKVTVEVAPQIDQPAFVAALQDALAGVTITLNVSVKPKAEAKQPNVLRAMGRPE